MSEAITTRLTEAADKLIDLGSYWKPDTDVRVTCDETSALLREAAAVLRLPHACMDTEAHLREVTQERDALRAALRDLVEAEWMVTHDWGGDRAAILERARNLSASQKEQTV